MDPEKPTMNAPILSEVVSNGHQPAILFWVGCAGSFDKRAQSITKAFALINLPAVRVNLQTCAHHLAKVQWIQVKQQN
jgi:hypothetical protein